MDNGIKIPQLHKLPPLTTLTAEMVLDLGPTPGIKWVPFVPTQCSLPQLGLPQDSFTETDSRLPSSLLMSNLDLLL